MQRHGNENSILPNTYLMNFSFGGDGDAESEVPRKRVPLAISKHDSDVYDFEETKGQEKHRRAASSFTKD